MSKSFLAAAYPRFESPDTSKDPKRGERARARVFREQISPAISPSAFSVLARVRAARPSSHIATRRVASVCIALYIQRRVYAARSW